MLSFKNLILSQSLTGILPHNTPDVRDQDFVQLCLVAGAGVSSLEAQDQNQSQRPDTRARNQEQEP